MASNETDPSKLIDQRIKELGVWRGKTLGRVREIIRNADPDIVEEWKGVKATNPGTPVWSHDGGTCTGETYKEVVKLTFFKGAAWTILQVCLTRASAARSGVPLTLEKMTRLTKVH